MHAWLNLVEPIKKIASLAADELETPPLSLRQLTWRRFRRHKMAMVGVVVLLLLILYAFGGALFISEKYANFNDTQLRLAAPSAGPSFRNGFDRAGYPGSHDLRRPDFPSDRVVRRDHRNRGWAS